MGDEEAQVIGLGLGPRNRFDADACAALGRDAISRARRLRVASVALQLPDPQAGDLDMAERMEALVNGAALGAARLGMSAATGTDVERIMVPPETGDVIEPQAALRADFDEAYARFRATYPAIKSVQ